jgi:hypothetical protein
MKPDDQKLAAGAVVIVIIVLLAMAACTTKTTITEPGGAQYIVEGKSDALVTYEEAGRKVVVDNRGKRSLFEDLIGVFTLRWMREDEGD